MALETYRSDAPDNFWKPVFQKYFRLSLNYVLCANTLITFISYNQTKEATLNDSGNSNPDNLFRYDEELGGYIFNLSTKGLSAGDYAFTLAADNLGDPIEHELTFTLKYRLVCHSRECKFTCMQQSVIGLMT